MRWMLNYLRSKWLLSLVILGAGMVLVYLQVVKPYYSQDIDTTPTPEQLVRKNQTFIPDTALLPKQQVHLISKIDTRLPVVFLTMDDGQYKEPKAIEFLKTRQWPVSLFLADVYAQQDYEYFKKIITNGATVQNHTLSHHYLTNLIYSEQKYQICAASDKAKEVFGSRPRLLRPPGGHYDNNTFTAAFECGIDAVVMWSAKVDGGEVQFQRGDKLDPGDIVLMHFRPKIMEDLAAFEAEIIKQNLYVARLEDWIKIAN